MLLQAENWEPLTSRNVTGQTAVATAFGGFQRYVGMAEAQFAPDDLAMIKTDDTVQNYNSNTVLDLADTLTNKFYVVKPVDSGLPQLRYTNIANNLIARKTSAQLYGEPQLEPKSLARYYRRRNRSGAGYLWAGDIRNSGRDTIKVIKRDLDVLVLDLPDSTAVSAV